MDEKSNSIAQDVLLFFLSFFQTTDRTHSLYVADMDKIN